MKRAQVAHESGLQPVARAVNRRQDSRIPVEFGLMYSAQTRSGEILIGDGMVTDLSDHGLGICGDTPVTPEMELAIFLYLPDGKDPLFVMESRVAWASSHRFGVEILKMNLRERNRLRHFLCSHPVHSD
jgi:PilZ domain